MKMAEHDWEVRESKACVRVLTLLESTIKNTVDLNQPPPEWDELQFAMFDTVKSKKMKYHECREAVEWTAQLLFSFQDVYVDLALEVIDLLRAGMRADRTPTGIHVDIYQHMTMTLDKYAAERILSTVSNFIQQFINQDVDQIVYI